MGLLNDYYAKNKKQNPLQTQPVASASGGTQGGGMLRQYQTQNKLKDPFQVAPVKKIAANPVKVTQVTSQQKSTQSATVTPVQKGKSNIFESVRKWMFEPPAPEKPQVVLPTNIKIEKKPLKQLPSETKANQSAQMRYEPQKKSIVPEGVKNKARVADDAVRSLVTGASDMQVAAGTTLQWMGLKGVGTRMAREGKKVQQYAPSTDFKNLSWKTMFDPQYYNDYINASARSVPMMASLIPATIIGAYAGTAAAGAVGLGAFGTFVLSSIGGAALSRPIESALEAGSTYDEALSRGKSEEEANKAANNTFLKNLSLSGLDAAELALAFLPSGKGKVISNILKKFGGASASIALSGGEEIAQNAINAQSQGDTFDVKSPENVASFVSGSLVGLGLPLASSTFDMIKTETIESFDEEGQKIYQKHIDAGLDPDQASLKTVDELAEKHPEKVKEIINDTLAREVVRNKVFTPDEALAFSTQSGIAKTEEGKQLNLMVLRAKEQGKNIRIVPSEDGGIEEIRLVSGDETAQLPNNTLETPEVKAPEFVSEKDQQAYESVQQNKETLRDQYIEKLGNVVNTDEARQFVEGYDPYNAYETHKAASVLKDEVYNHLLETRKGEGNNTVLNLAGSPGAGKTTGLNALLAEGEKDNYSVILDSTFSGKDAQDIIDRQLAEGYKAHIIYTLREPLDAWKGVISRSTHEKRTLGEEYFLKSFEGAREQILKLYDHYQGNPNVTIEFVDNTKGAGKAEATTVDFVRNFSYNKEELQQLIRKETDNAKSSGQIDDRLYQGLTNDRQSGASKVSEGSQSRGTQRSETRSEPQSSSGKRVLNTKEVTALKKVIDDRFKELRELSSSEKDFTKKLNELYKDVVSQANNDKVVLSALRTKLNEEMYGIVGKSGNYKADYAALQGLIKEGGEMGQMLSAIEDKVLELDEKLLSAQEPERVKPVLDKPQSGKRDTTPSKETPVGTGRTKNSRLFERVKDTLGSEYENENRKYNVLDLEKQARSVADLIEENPDKAIKIARGKEEPPQGMTQNAVAVGLAEVARAKGDYATAAMLWTQTSLRSTRLGQEIVSLRGNFSGNESLNAVKSILNVRMNDVARRYSDVIKGLSVSDDAPAVKKVDALVKHQAKKLKKEMVAKQRKIQSAQEILNDLMCKV